MTEEYTKITGIQNYRKREIHDDKNEASLRILYFVSYISDMCLLEKCEQGWDFLYNNYCAENKYDMETCKMFEENIILALKTRKVLE